MQTSATRPTRSRQVKRWLVAAVGLVTFAVVALCTMLATERGHQPEFGEAVVATVPTVVVLFPLTMITALRRRRRYREGRPELTDEQHDLAARAVWRGPIPTDPAITAEAAARARSQLAGSGSGRGWPRTLLLGAVAASGVAGAVFYSPWLWPIAGLYLAWCAWSLVRSYRLPPRLAQLQQVVRTQPDPWAGSRSAVGQADHSEATLVLTVRPPWLNPSPEIDVTIDGLSAPVTVGINRFRVGPGRHRVAASALYWRSYGWAETTFEATPSSDVQLHYSPPAAAFFSGRIGTVRQPVPGAVVSWVCLAAIVAVVAALVIWGG